MGLVGFIFQVISDSNNLNLTGCTQPLCVPFQVNKLDKAVAAANTFFQANPDHIEMRQNLEYYRMMAGVQEEDFKDLEARTHMVGANSFSD